MKILAIDPGYDRLGIAVLEKDAPKKEELLFSECFQTSSKDDFYVRLKKLGREVESIINQFEPEALAIETLFFNTNQKTALKVSEARGVVVYQSLLAGLSVHEYTPLQIKMAITGDGRADKKQMIFLIPKLIEIKKEIQHDDEYDAIAAGLTYFAYGERVPEKA